MLDLEKCTGCSACANICPVNAIHLETNVDGFVYPKIDSEKCINCLKCEKTCPLNISNMCSNKFYIAQNDDINIRKKSSSGGLFFEIAKYIIAKDGYVCAAMFDDDLILRHKITNDLSIIGKMQESKYVQSYMGDCFSKIKAMLNKNIMVLFVGTPCQVNGLKSFLGKEYSKLITIDFLCHGVPSPKALGTYLSRIEKKYSISSTVKVSKISFRNKDRGWQNYQYKIELSNGINIVESHQDNLYSKLFLSDLYLRKSCYTCSFKSNNRKSDLTLGDFWGARHFKYNIKNDDTGLSVVVVHNDKMLQILKTIHNINLEFTESDIMSYNNSYSTSPKRPIEREKFIMTLNQDNFEELVMKYTYKKTNFLKKTFKKMKRFLLPK